MADPAQGTPPGGPAPPPVAGNGHANPPGNPPPAVSAGALAPPFGGLKGGRTRKDGLVPGSPEALEADRKKDAARKRKQRAADPPPLPSAGPGAPAGVPAAPGGVAPVPGLAPDAPIPWDPQALTPLFEQLVPTLEDLSVQQIAGKAQEAKLPAELVKEIEHDAKWSDLAKKGLIMSGPKVSAKWLNKFGVPSGSQDEIILVTSVGAILATHNKLLKRLNELIAAANPPSTKPPEKKP